jgi:hypothetical protein
MSTQQVEKLRAFGPQVLDLGPVPKNEDGSPVIQEVAGRIIAWIQENLGIPTVFVDSWLVARVKGNGWHADSYEIPDLPRDPEDYNAVPDEMLKSNGGPAGLPWQLRPNIEHIQIAASTLLSDPSTYEGGVLEVYDGADVRRYKDDVHEKSVLFGGSWQHVHRVTPNTGGRRALIIWLKAV